MANIVGVIEPCPEGTPSCDGEFKRGSTSQKRCGACSKWLKNRKSKHYQRKKRANPQQFKDIAEEFHTRNELDQDKIHDLHPCWCCGQPTKRRALCDVCYQNDGKVRHGSEGTCYLNRQQLERVERRLRKLLAEKVKTYSCKEMTQQELQLLVPSHEA
jgi:hypothetical protein